MNNLPQLIKKRLNKCIKKLCENKSGFVKHPDKDFTRNRKISLESLINLIINFKSKSSSIELLEFSVTR